ncbi:hypothetical protein GA0115246_110602, partial [Streptomyces sp. SolWspMP-sol7th]
MRGPHAPRAVPARRAAPPTGAPAPSAPRARAFDTGYRPRTLTLRRTTKTLAELVRAPAALTVPGDVVAGALASARTARVEPRQDRAPRGRF